MCGGAWSSTTYAILGSIDRRCTEPSSIPIHPIPPSADVSCCLIGCYCAVNICSVECLCDISICFWNMLLSTLQRSVGAVFPLCQTDAWCTVNNGIQSNPAVIFTIRASVLISRLCERADEPLGRCASSGQMFRKPSHRHQDTKACVTLLFTQRQIRLCDCLHHRMGVIVTDPNEDVTWRRDRMIQT